jgi:hypothetical protein
MLAAVLLQQKYSFFHVVLQLDGKIITLLDWKNFENLSSAQCIL